MKKFEYKVTFLETKINFASDGDKKIENELNYWGKEGWELIEVIDKSDVLSLKRMFQFFFKREIE
tara:strand:+ start:173 stop:367 length:195 start_codon:yes stop_codon:yes gene_type:complete